MKVLVTGASGFVGTHMLAHLLANTDWEVIGVDSFRHKGKSDRIRDLFTAHPDYKKRLKIIMCDLRAPISEQTDYEFGKVDYVLNIASESHVDRSISHPREFIENNSGLMLTMLEWLRKHPEVKSFIQTSTDEVFGPAETVDHPEGDPHKPSNPYAASKAAQEDLCYAYWRTYKLPIIITNTMNMIGSLQETEKYLPKIIKYIKEEKTIPVHSSSEGIPGSRYYLHVRNQCDAQLFLLKNQKPTLYPADDIDRFNIVSDDEIDNLDMLERVAKAMDVSDYNYELVDFHSERPGHDRRYGLDGNKMKKLGWKPPVPISQSLPETVRWYLDRPEWLL